MDSQAKIVNCMQIAALACGLEAPDEDQVKHIIGISLLPAIKQLFTLSDSDSDHQLAISIREAYKTAYLEQDQTPCPLFDGVNTMLAELQQRGINMAVATGKARRGLQRAWQNTKTGCYFIASRTADEAESKPSCDMLEQLLAELGISADQAIMVGDTSYDMQMAKQLNMQSIAVTYGVHNVEQLNTQTPTYTVNTVSQLHQLLLKTANAE